jgi:hypothetical protein
MKPCNLKRHCDINIYGVLAIFLSIMTHSLVHVNVQNIPGLLRDYGYYDDVDPACVYSTAMTHFLEIFKELNILATFFVVAEDVEHIREASAFCEAAIRDGHEIANFGYTHSHRLSHLCVSDLGHEISRSHDVIARAVGIAPKGFRGPGYYSDMRILKLISSLGYHYDSSVLAGWTPLIIRYYLIRNLGLQAGLFQQVGKLWDLAALNKVQSIDTGSGIRINQLPITTVPFLRIPFDTHAAYQFGEDYLDFAKRALEIIQPKYIVHLFNSADLFDFGDLLPGRQELPRIPAARWSVKRRIELLRSLLVEFPGKNISTLNYLNEIESRSIWQRVPSRL